MISDNVWRTLQGRQHEEDSCHPQWWQEATAFGRSLCPPTWKFISFFFFRCLKLLLVFSEFGCFQVFKVLLFWRVLMNSCDFVWNLVFFCEFSYVLTIFVFLGWVGCELPVKARRLLQGDESRHLYQVLLQETPEILCKKYIWDIHKSIGMDSELGGRRYILTLVEDDEEELVFDEDKH